MKVKFYVLFMMLGILIFAAPAITAYTDAEWAKLKTGEVLVKEVTSLNADGSQKIHFEAKIFMKASREQIWKIMHDYNRFGDFFPNVVETKVIEQKGEAYWVQYHTKVMWVEARYVLKFDGVEKNKKIIVDLDKTRPHDIRETHSEWLFEDSPDKTGTVVTYTTFVDTGIAAPVSLARKASKMALPNVVGNVRKRVESGGVWKKDAGS